jgi:hypothetical protein
MEHKVKIEDKKYLTHDVIQFTVEKPEGFTYTAGQAVEASLDDPKFKNDWAPFTMTSINNDRFLQFTIKIYSAHNGMTRALSKLNVDDFFLITDPWDSFISKGPGVFIAGGTGVTPFIALLRQMDVDGTVGESTLLFSNKTEADIFLADEFKKILGDNFINIITRDEKSPFYQGRIDKKLLKKYVSSFKQPFYLCGPDNFAEDIKRYLIELGAGDDLVNISL